MIKLTVQQKKFNQYTDINKFALIPKKYWNLFTTGENNLIINSTNTKVIIYEIPCDCTGNKHHHMIIDLADIWNKLRLTNGDKICISK